MSLAAKSEGVKESHEGGGARKCMHGYVCQLNLCATNFLCAYRSGLNFRLASEVGAIKDYDDMILMYKGENGRETQLYVQAKHFQNCNDKVITARHLLNGKIGNKFKDERFLLSKYYESYLKNEISSEKHYFIIYTNMGLDINDLSKKGINVVAVNVDRFFHNCYKISIDENNSLFKKIYSLSDANKVAEELVKKIKDKETLGTNNNVLQKYKHFLGLKVLDRNENDGKKRRFGDEFISCKNLPPELKTFRSVFKKIYYETIKPSYGFDCEDAFQEDLRTKMIEVSESFLELDEKEIKVIPDPTQSIKTFLNEFILAVKQPNVTELDEIIKKEIEEIFRIKDTDLIAPVIKSRMLDWMKRRTGTWLTEDDAESFVQDIKQNMGALMTRGISLDYQNKIKGMNCVIQTQKLEDDSTVQSIKNFLHEECEIMLIHSSQSLLTLLKINQAIDWMKGCKDLKCFEKDDDLLFLPFSCLVSTESVRYDLKNKNTFNLLVSDVQEKALNEVDCQGYLKDLFDSVVSKKRKIVLVFQKDVFNLIDSIIKYIDNERVYHNSEIILDTPPSFLELDENSQNHLLQLKIVNFQGELTKLSLLSSEVKNIIDQDILLRLLQKESISVGNSGKEIFFSDPYIPRQLSIHDFSSETLTEAAVSAFISEDKLLSNEFGKVRIISGPPLSGKSVLLQSLSKKMKKRYPNIWLLKIDLNKYTEICSKMALYNTSKEQDSYGEDEEKTIDFIVEKLLEWETLDAIKTSRFEKELLKFGFRGEMKLALLIDGLSDLCKDGLRFFIQLLKGIAKTNVEMLLITTRLENKDKLKCLDRKYFSLDFFESDEHLNVVRLKSAINMPLNLDEIYKKKLEKIKKILSHICMSDSIEVFGTDERRNNIEELRLESQNLLGTGLEKALENLICSATDGHYSSITSSQQILNAISYIIKKKLDVNTQFVRFNLENY